MSKALALTVCMYSVWNFTLYISFLEHAANVCCFTYTHKSVNHALFFKVYCVCYLLL